MKRFLYLVVLMALSSSADAGNSFAFVVAGHRVIIEAPRDCNSPSCLSVSIPGIYQTRGGRDGDDDTDDTSDTPDAAAPAKPAAAAKQQVATPPIVQAAPAAAALPPSKIQSANTQQPKPLQPKPLPVSSSLPVKSSVDTPTQTVPPAPAPLPVQVLQETDDDPAEAPLGDWQTEGNKGSVRIERCGRALCGYVLNPSSNSSGETVLINMKPKTASEWSGNIYSRDSGSTYYATIAMKGSDSLRVEACALGRFFCSGNVWSRIGAKSEKLVTSRRASWVPRS
jgi:uncharacterized protein DUF2147